MLGALIRLRCPHCRQGKVIKKHFDVYDHCEVCGFKFCRDGDPAYFGGAVFVNYMFSAGLFVTSLVGISVSTWPNVPWTFISFVLPPVTIATVVLFYPVSKVIWLTVDVRVRPVGRNEIVALDSK